MVSLSDELLMHVFWAQLLVKALSTERKPEVIRLDSASEIIAPRVYPNESEDLSLSISEKIWVDDTLNNFVAGLNY